MAYIPGATPGAGVLAEYLARELRRISAELAAINSNVRYETAASQVAAGDEILIMNVTSGTATIVLPPLAISFGRELLVKKIDATANTVVLDGTGAETIDGAATRTLSAQYAFIRVAAGITDWHIIGR